jgi:hypothetical protein
VSVQVNRVSAIVGLLAVIYRADDQLFVNQHTFGIPASRSPVFCLRKSEDSEMVTAYLDSFERVWTAARPTESSTI